MSGASLWSPAASEKDAAPTARLAKSSAKHAAAPATLTLIARVLRWVAPPLVAVLLSSNGNLSTTPTRPPCENPPRAAPARVRRPPAPRGQAAGPEARRIPRRAARPVRRPPRLRRRLASLGHDVPRRSDRITAGLRRPRRGGPGEGSHPRARVARARGGSTSPAAHA